MDAGLITRESFPNVLRNISQRRRQGTLEIRNASQEIRLYFIQGKIAELQIDETSPRGEVVAMLQDAGLVPVQVVFYQETYAELLAALQQAAPDANLDEGLLRQVIHYRVLDRLYGIELTAGAYFTFKVEMVNIEREFCPMISVGQVLLDLVDYEGVLQRFEELTYPKQLVRKVAQILPEGLSVEERTVLLTITDDMTIEMLAKQSLLSRFHLAVAVLSLLDRHAIELEKSESKGDVLDTEGLLSALDSTIDQAYEAELQSLESGAASETPDGGEVVKEAPPAEALHPSGRVGRTQQQLLTINADLAKRSWAAEVGTILFLIAAVVLPFFSWRAIVQWFEQ